MVAVVGAQTVRMRASGHEVAQVSGGVPTVLMWPFASARSDLGAVRGHSDPSLPPLCGHRLGSTDPAGDSGHPWPLLGLLRTYAESAKHSSITEDPQTIDESQPFILSSSNIHTDKTIRFNRWRREDVLRYATSTSHMTPQAELLR